MKNTGTEFGESRKVALILSQLRGEHSRITPQELCFLLHPTPTRGLYKMRAHSQELMMRNKGVRLLIFSSCTVSEL